MKLQRARRGGDRAGVDDLEPATPDEALTGDDIVADQIAVRAAAAVDLGGGTLKRNLACAGKGNRAGRKDARAIRNLEQPIVGEKEAACAGAVVVEVRAAAREQADGPGVDDIAGPKVVGARASRNDGSVKRQILQATGKAQGSARLCACSRPPKTFPLIATTELAAASIVPPALSAGVRPEITSVPPFA